MSRIRSASGSGTHSRFSLKKVALLAVGVGMLAGIAAEILHRLIGLVTNLAFYQHLGDHIVSPMGTPYPILLILVPAIGGLIIGFMARYGTPLVRGHGIPEAMEAVLLKRSRISPKVAVLKPISAAISIGSGQPFGAEGPVIQTGAALGSLLGQAFNMTPAERKVLLACGAAGGLAATFGTPVAAIILVIELLLFEFRTRSFIPLVIATAVATGVHISILGAEPLFSVPPADFGSPINLIFFVGLGVIAGLVAIALTKGLYLVEDAYHKLPISTYLWPALGGLFVGVVGFILHMLGLDAVDVFGPGYHIIDAVLQGGYTLDLLVLLLLAKGIVWLVSLGSGTSGGTLAPIFLVGAALGSIYGNLLAAWLPGFSVAPVAFAMAGMAAVFGSSTRATFASIVFAFEITQDYQAILPVMIASVIADAIAHRLTRTNILTEQLRRSGVLVNHDYEADVLNMVPVSAVMISDPATIPPTMQIGELMDRINRHEEPFSTHQAVLVTEEGQGIRGLLTRGDLLRSMELNPDDLSSRSVIEIASSPAITAFPDESVRSALDRMLRFDVGRLAVVQRAAPDILIGYLSRASIIEAYRKRMHEESQIERGWLPSVTESHRSTHR